MLLAWDRAVFRNLVLTGLSNVVGAGKADRNISLGMATTEQLEQRILAKNNELLKKGSFFQRRSWRHARDRAEITKDVTQLMANKSVPLQRRLSILTATTATGSVKMSAAFALVPPQIKAAVIAAGALALVFAGILSVVLGASRAIQQMVSEASRAGTTVSSVYRSAAAGTAVGLPLQEAYMLTSSLSSEATSNMASIAKSYTALEDANKILRNIGSPHTFQGLLNMEGIGERELAIMQELLRLEGAIEHRGRREAAQSAFLTDVIGFSEFDENFPLMSILKRGEMSRVLKAWQEANPLTDKTYNDAARFAGMFDRLGAAAINMGGALGAALAPIAEPFLTRIYKLLERIGKWFEENPTHVERFFRGMAVLIAAVVAVIDPLLYALGAIATVIGSIIYLLGWLTELFGIDADDIIKSGALGSAETLFPDNRTAVSQAQGSIRDDISTASGNTYYQYFESHDEFIIQGVQDGNEAADQISERKRNNYNMFKQ